MIKRIQINCDASVKGNGFIGVGFVVRNSLGLSWRLVLIGFKVILLGGGVETIAIRSAMKFAKECGFQKFLVKSDCSNVMRRLSHKVLENSYLSLIIGDCVALVSLFEYVVFLHVCKTRNMVAHALAELAQIFEFSILVF